jgi:hypothetical protein
MPILVCDKIDCVYYDEFDLCAKPIVEIKNGICQVAEYQLFKELKKRQERRMNRSERRKLMKNKKYRTLIKHEAQKAVNGIETAVLRKNQENNTQEM